MAGAGADAEAVPGKARGQDEARHGRHFADAGNTVRRAVDEAGPGVRDLGVAKLGQQFDGAAVGLPDREHIGLRIEDAHPFHRRRRIEPPPRQRFMATPNAFQASRKKVAPALGEHRHELRGEAHELRRQVHARAAADGQCVASVVAARGGHARGRQGSRQAMFHRGHAQDGLADRGLRKTDAQLAAERGRPGAAGEHGRPGLDDAGFRDDAADPSAFRLDAAGRAMLVDAAAELDQRSCHGRRGLAGIGGAIGGREDAAFPGAAGRLPALGGLSAAQHVGRHAGGLRKITPAGPTRQLGLVVAEVQQPAAMKAGVFTALGGKSFPEIEALARHRQFASVAVLLAAPAPVAARLLGADPALLDQGDRHAALGQVVGGEDTDDAAADHDDVSRGRRRGGSVDVLQRRGHGASRSSVQAWTLWHT